VAWGPSWFLCLTWSGDSPSTVFCISVSFFFIRFSLSWLLPLQYCQFLPLINLSLYYRVLCFTLVFI
jgi:hypothetical protein